MARPERLESFPTWHGRDNTVLSWDDLDVVRALLAETAPAWSAELNQSGPGESTVVVLPEGANDLLGPAFILHRTLGRVHLDQFRWDEYRELGGFACLDDALAALRARLVPLAARRLSKT